MNISEKTEIGLKSMSNSTLLVDFEVLRLAEIMPVDLTRILTIGRQAILDDLESFYQNMQIKHPGATIGHPPVLVVELGPRDRVLTNEGHANNTNIHRSIQELRSGFQPYWQAVEDAGFPAEARSMSNTSSKDWVTHLSFDIDEN